MSQQWSDASKYIFIKLSYKNNFWIREDVHTLLLINELKRNA